MRLRNKKTGQVGNFIINKDHFECVDLDYVPEYRNITELNEEWEDLPEEPKVGYIIDPMEEDYVSADDSGYEESDIERAKELGIWLETKEEAEQAVEKLKAYKRLKDKGFKFTSYGCYGEYGEKSPNIDFSYPNFDDLLDDDEVVADLDLLFVGEEEDE